MKPEIKEKLVQNEKFWEKLIVLNCPHDLLDEVPNYCPDHSDCNRHWNELVLTKTSPSELIEDPNYQFGELHSGIYDIQNELKAFEVRKTELEQLFKVKKEKS